MAFDGIITWAISQELAQELTLGKIDKIHQPEKDGICIQVHTKQGRKKLYASVSTNGPRLHLSELNFDNPPEPPLFCMVLRKHLQGARIDRITQVASERIIEIYFQAMDDMGFSISKKLVFEIMGKHSNIILVNISNGRIIDSIKRVSIDVNRARQILPGMPYTYPPIQNKIGFKEPQSTEIFHKSGDDAGFILDQIGGISPAVATTLAISEDGASLLRRTLANIELGNTTTRIYMHHQIPLDFHVMDIGAAVSSKKKIENYNDIKVITFPHTSQALEFFYLHKSETNTVQQLKSALTKKIEAILAKLMLKKQRMEEDLLKAKKSDNLRLYGELLTANIHAIKKGDSSAILTNYYDGTELTIPLDHRLSPAQNAQRYYKRYGKAMNTIKEKEPILTQISQDIDYLESVVMHLSNANTLDDLEGIRQELIQVGYINKVKQEKKNNKNHKNKLNLPAQPIAYTSPSGYTIKVGRNNRENDVLTTKIANKTDLWFHTKDIPGSHVILFTNSVQIDDLSKEDILCAAAVAAYHSKGRASSNVPVDYTAVRHVKKPGGAKPGMVIFKNHNTIWVDPTLPDKSIDQNNV